VTTPCLASKLFNGIAAMNLVEDGQLSLDAALTNYDKNLSVSDHLGSEEPVTVRSVLSHISGLPREGTQDYWSDRDFPDTANLLKQVSEHEQLYRPYDY